MHVARKCTHAVGHSRVGGVLILNGAAVRPQIHLIRQRLFPANVFNHVKSRTDTANVRTSALFPLSKWKLLYVRYCSFLLLWMLRALRVSTRMRVQPEVVKGGVRSAEGGDASRLAPRKLLQDHKA